MERILSAVLLWSCLILGACQSSGGPGSTTTATPNPPFAGQAPEDACRSEGEPGVYGGTLALALPQNPKTFNPVLANETSTFLVINQAVYKALTDYVYRVNVIVRHQFADSYIAQDCDV